MRFLSVLLNVVYVLGWVWAIETEHKLVYLLVTTLLAFLFWGRQILNVINQASIGYAEWCTRKSRQLLEKAGVVCDDCGLPLKDCRCDRRAKT